MQQSLLFAACAIFINITCQLMVPKTICQILVCLVAVQCNDLGTCSATCTEGNRDFVAIVVRLPV